MRTLIFILCFSVSAQSSPQKLGQAYKLLSNGENEKAYRIAKKLRPGSFINKDYVLYVQAQSAFAAGYYRKAKNYFSALADTPGRFRSIAKWRMVDSMYEAGQKNAAVEQYKELIQKSEPKGIDRAIAHYRVATSYRGTKRIDSLTNFLRVFPKHPLERSVFQELQTLKVQQPLSDNDRLIRSKAMTKDHLWHESIAELSNISDNNSASFLLKRDYQRGMTWFKMRRRYEDAGRLLLKIYPRLGADAPHAMFHGARGLSRADKDSEAIIWYQKMVAAYPNSKWAQEAQYLSGWLEFNMGNYKAAIPHLRKMKKLYPRSKWIAQTNWFLAMSQYLSKDYRSASTAFKGLAKQSGRWQGGKGQYWYARSLQKLGEDDQANQQYRGLVSRFPLSWYALLAIERLKEEGTDIPIFGDSPKSSAVTKIEGRVDGSLAKNDVVRKAEELSKAGLFSAAASEMKRAERTLIKKHGKTKALVFLLDRYRKSGNFNRPWYLAIVHGGWRAFDAPPKGNNKAWWKHGYPLAYEKFVNLWRGIGGSPDYFLYSIMRKESGFDPNTRSYAEALGLLQMIPPTTQKVVKEVGLTYADDLLYDPEKNIKTASWYIGQLYRKFKKQIPLAAGSYNAGPKAMMKWCKRNKGYPMDVFVELVSYRQSRLYIKKVTETYARYKYFYANEQYRVPLTVDTDFIDNEINY